MLIFLPDLFIVVFNLLIPNVFLKVIKYIFFKYTGEKMSRVCEICDKKTSFGNNVSHSHRKTRRTFKPNVHKTKVEYKGKIKTINICTNCLKSGKVKKIV